MRTIFSIFIVTIVHLNLNLAYADATDDFMQTLKTTPFDAIDVALVRLELFTDRENRNSSATDTQLKFIHTNNRIELTGVIKKPKSEISIAACDNALKKLKSAYKSTALTKIAFPDYSSGDQKLAVKVFNYQALLVDKMQPSKIFACNWAADNRLSRTIKSRQTKNQTPKSSARIIWRLLELTTTEQKQLKVLPMSLVAKVWAIHCLSTLEPKAMARAANPVNPERS